MASVASRAVAFVAATIVLSGIVYGVFVALPTITLSPRGVGLQLFEAQINGTAGHTLSIPIKVTNLLAKTQEVNLSIDPKGGPFSSTRVTLTLGPNQIRSTWVPMGINASASPGMYAPRLVADIGVAVPDLYSTQVSLQVLGSNGGIAIGDRATVRYTALLANRSVYDSNEPWGADPTFPLMPGFSSPRSTVVTWSIVPGSGSNPIPGLTPYMLGLVPGESREIRVPAAQVFGNATLTSQFPRTNTFLTRFSTNPGITSLPRANWSIFLSNSHQNPAATYHVGDKFTFALSAPSFQTGIPVPVTLTAIGATDSDNVTWTYPAINSPFTLFTNFPNGTSIESENATQWTLHTVPTVAVGKPFTYSPYWPNESEIVSCTPTCADNYSQAQSVLIQHEMPIGYSFNYSYQGIPVLMTVTQETSSTFTVTFRNINPYGGIDALYEVEVLSVTRASGSG
ncbi:MAG: FKBP-type peptidyl-prolyl cis-trans isomerase [Thermoplasmatota archaeon]